MAVSELLVLILR